MNNGKYINKTLADFVMERDSIAQDIFTKFNLYDSYSISIKIFKFIIKT